MEDTRFDVVTTLGGTKYAVLESQLLFGEEQGPSGGVLTLKDGHIVVGGAGEARLEGGLEEQGGTFPARLRLSSEGVLVIEIAAHEAPTGPSKARVSLEGNSATLRMRAPNGNEHVLLDGARGDLWLGGKSAGGQIRLFALGQADNRNQLKATVNLDGAIPKITLRSEEQERLVLDGNLGDIRLGGRGADGDLRMYRSQEQDNQTSAKATIHLNGGTGKLFMRSGTGQDRIVLDGGAGALWLGGKDVHGEIYLFHGDEDDNSDKAKATIRLSSQEGDIVLRNADCAEDFDVAADADAEPGSVMVIGCDGRLKVSDRAYDRRVAGVVSGARDLKPGIVLGRQDGAASRRPIALSGRVWCQVDASASPIETGDLLTTSSVPGCAMRAVDPARAFGAVLGKALAPLDAGRDLIPVLVALQ
jgi:hypothetical protein